LSAFVGELAALVTSFLFAATSTQFTLAGRKVGSLVLNRTRLILAVLLNLLAHLVLRLPLPADIPSDRWFWLGLSGIIGLVIGDIFLFQAFVWIGPRLTMLMMSLAPIIASITAWLFLGETLTAGQISGILVTVGGIAWVVLDHNGQAKIDQDNKRIFMLGILFGLGAATGQALGLITAKKGLYGDFPALSGTLVRMMVALVTMWGLTLIQRQVRFTFQQLARNRKALWLILGGAITGPFLGVTFSLVAIQNTEVGVASTIMALPPVILLPISRIVFKEQFGWQAIVGTLIAVLGVTMLFLLG
jgi:drug/metabolite transporter (DMT)-like permease